MTTGAKWCSTGTNGAGGAAAQTIAGVTVRPRPAARSRAARNASAARSCSTASIANWTIGPSSCSRNSNSVTTPKLPPPPRSAQKRSGCSSALARTERPSASTTCADSRLSIVNPCIRLNQPQPPPSVRPPTPVWLTVPAGTASPCSWVAASSSPSVAPPPTRARRASGSTTTWRIGLRSIITPPSGTAAPQYPCPPPRTATSSPESWAYRSAAATSSGPVHRTMTAGRRSMSPFHTDRASSYPPSPGSSTAPFTTVRSVVTSLAMVCVMSSPSNWSGDVRPPLMTESGVLAGASAVVPEPPRARATRTRRARLR